jgi:putative nucleotidyltransferase with HDIG domain
MKPQTNIVENERLYQRISTMVEAMPPFSKSVHQVLTMSSDINCSPKDLVSVIERDPVLTMKILKMVNSAFFSLSRSVASVQHALAYLGMNTVKNMAVTIATVDALPRKSIPELPISSFLTHSLGTAAVAQRLARENLQIRDASDYFVAGLLHDFGKAVFVQYKPTTYAKILHEARQSNSSLVQIEIEQMGVSHAEVGAMLAESWQLPSVLVECIRTHAVCDEQSSDLIISVAAANTVVKNMKLGDSGNPDVGSFPDFICRRLGSDLETIIAQMQDLPEELRSIQGMVRG